ncbi:MAG TPA: hypothetical protein VFH66_03820 [Mycobacteriales bacterium]|nr:hypothetical protein [Mycobacteriales bacterium]
MRRLVQLAALVTLVLSGVMIAGSFTAADATATSSTKPGVLQAAWFWQTAYEQAAPPVAAGPAPASEPSGVPDGDLPVAHTSGDGSSSKMTALAFDVSALPPGSVVNSFTFSVTVDNSPQAVNSSAAAAPVVACLPTRLWPATLGGDYTDEPAVDCTNKVKPKIDGSTYTFDITSFAQSWVDDQNFGVALVNDPDNTQTPFQVAFTGAKTVKATMSATPAAPVPTTQQPVSSSGGTTAAGGVTTTSGASSVAPPTGSVPPDTSVATTADSGQAPQVASSTTTPQLRAVAHVSPASSAPSRGFWIGAAAFALLILLMSLVLGDQPVAARTGGGSRLDRVLRGASPDGSALATRS